MAGNLWEQWLCHVLRARFHSCHLHLQSHKIFLNAPCNGTQVVRRGLQISPSTHTYFFPGWPVLKVLVNHNLLHKGLRGGLRTALICSYWGINLECSLILHSFNKIIVLGSIWGHWNSITMCSWQSLQQQACVAFYRVDLEFTLKELSIPRKFVPLLHSWIYLSRLFINIVCNILR